MIDDLPDLDDPAKFSTRALIEKVLDGSVTEMDIAPALKETVMSLLSGYQVFGSRSTDVFLPWKSRIAVASCEKTIVQVLNGFTPEQLQFLLQKFSFPQIVIVPEYSGQELLARMNAHKIPAECGFFGDVYASGLQDSLTATTTAIATSARIMLVEASPELCRPCYRLGRNYAAIASELEAAGLSVADPATVLVMTQCGLMYHYEGGSYGLHDPAIPNQRTKTVVRLCDTAQTLATVCFGSDTQFRVIISPLSEQGASRKLFIRPALELARIHLE